MFNILSLSFQMFSFLQHFQFRFALKTCSVYYVPTQVKYAALDALIAIDIIHAIAKIKLESARRRISTTRGSSWLIRLFRWLTEKVSDEWSNGLTWDNPEVLDSLHSLSQGLSDVKISTEVRIFVLLLIILPTFV